MRPPTPTQVVERAYALTAVIAFGQGVGTLGILPSGLANLPEERVRAIEQKVKAFAGRILVMTQKFGVLDHLSLLEKKTLATPYHDLNDQALFSASWRKEALQVLLWALNVVDNLPDYSVLADTKAASVLDVERFEEMRNSAKLRSSEQIEMAREVAELWHWRCRTRQLIERGDEFPKELSEKSQFTSYDDVVRFTTKAARERNFPPDLQVVDEDFAVAGRALRDMPHKEFSDIFSMALERHFALNWLCGYAPANNWDKTPTDT